MRGVTLFEITGDQIFAGRLYLEEVERDAVGIEQAVEALSGRRPEPMQQQKDDSARPLANHRSSGSRARSARHRRAVQQVPAKAGPLPRDVRVQLDEWSRVALSSATIVRPGGASSAARVWRAASSTWMRGGSGGSVG